MSGEGEVKHVQSLGREKTGINVGSGTRCRGTSGIMKGER